MKIKGVKFRVFAAILGLVVMGIGIWQITSRPKNFVKTTAVIVSIEEDEAFSDDDSNNYITTVKYTVNGKEYTEVLGEYSPSYKVGKEVGIAYDPADPSKIYSTSGLIYILTAIGAVVFLAAVISAIREKRSVKQLREVQPEAEYAPSVKGEERELYFITDRGTAKYGHRIEDRNRSVLYEAKVTKFTLTQPTGFDFIDHVNNRTTAHLVGHEEDQEWSSILIDNYSTFTFDGEDIWKHLKRNGITIDTNFKEGKPLWLTYRISREDEEIAYAEASTIYPHEEDAESHGKIANAIPERGYYRIWTKEQNLDLLFVALLAFARTTALDGEGGNYGLFLKKKKK